MPREYCRRCRKEHPGGVGLSTRYLCLDCSRTAVEQSCEQLARREGPYHERWVKSMQRVAARYARSTGTS